MKLIYSLTLTHHGVEGQHWYVRRYQPYPKGHKIGKEIGEAAKAGKKKKESRYDRVKNMSDGELTTAINRLKKEKEYLDLTGNTVTKGKNFAENLLIATGTAAVTTFATTMATKGGQAAVSAILKKVLPSSVYNSVYKKK